MHKLGAAQPVGIQQTYRSAILCVFIASVLRFKYQEIEEVINLCRHRYHHKIVQ